MSDTSYFSHALKLKQGGQPEIVSAHVIPQSHHKRALIHQHIFIEKRTAQKLETSWMAAMLCYQLFSMLTSILYLSLLRCNV